MSTAKSPDAYVDTSALIAFADQSDSHHLVFRRLFSDPPALVTTPLVVTEGHAWFLRRYDQIKALHFLSMLEVMKPLTIISVGAPELAAASDLIRRPSSNHDRRPRPPRHGDSLDQQLLVDRLPSRSHGRTAGHPQVAVAPTRIQARKAAHTRVRGRPSSTIGRVTRLRSTQSSGSEFE